MSKRATGGKGEPERASRPSSPIINDRRAGTTASESDWLRLFFAAAPVGIARLDLNGVLMDCNDAFEQLVGAADGKSARGQAFSEVIARQDRDDLARQLSKLVMGTARFVRLDSIRFGDAGDDSKRATLVAAALTEQAEIAGLAVYAIGERHRGASQAMLTQAQKMQAIGQLAGGIAHDFNNLLTGMLGFCDLLLTRHPPADPSHEEILQIRANAVRAGNLVRQLLAFSRKQTLAPVRLAVDRALAELSAMLARLLGPRIELILESGDPRACIEVDPGQFDQVIINLAVNARDAMPAGGTLTIRTAVVTVERPIGCGEEEMPAGRYVRIELADTGVGIPKEIIGNIFEPFFTTKEGAGTGLGLATVFGIVRQTGGYILVDSALGEGSTFSVYLPAAESLAETASAGESTSDAAMPPTVGGASPASGEGERQPVVLLVDDEDPVRVFAARGLRKAGFRVLEAASGEQALDVLASQQPQSVDLLLTDVVMPGMDGHTLAQLVQRDHPAIRIVAMSGFQEDVSGSRGSYLAGFLDKPFSLAELTAKTRAVLAVG